MSHARTLTELYWRFYRAGRPLNSNRILRPITVASRAILDADRRLFDQEGLVEIVRGELSSFVERVINRRADGFIPRIEVGERKAVDEAAIQEFADYFVNTLFIEALNGDLSALRGKQLNLLRSACEVIYRDLDAKHWAERNQDAGTSEDSA